MSCVQRDCGLFSCSSTLSREQSVGARRRACPTHRRRLWHNSADIGGTSVSCRTRSRVRCSSGVLATMRRSRRKRPHRRQCPTAATALPHRNTLVCAASSARRPSDCTPSDNGWSTAATTLSLTTKTSRSRNHVHCSATRSSATTPLQLGKLN